MRTAPPIRVIAGIEFWSLETVRARTGVSRRLILRALETGMLPAKKFGAAWYTHALWVEQWTTTPAQHADGDSHDLQVRTAWQRMKRRIAAERDASSTTKGGT